MDAQLKFMFSLQQYVQQVPIYSQYVQQVPIYSATIMGYRSFINLRLSPF